MSSGGLARVLGGLCLMAALATAYAARADVLHAYVLIESQDTDEARIRNGLGADLGMCKYVIIGTSPTEAVGRSETIARFDCEGQDDLNRLITQAGSGIEGVTRVSVLAVSRSQ